MALIFNHCRKHTEGQLYETIQLCNFDSIISLKYDSNVASTLHKVTVKPFNYNL